jgi:hypothetical protein
MVEPFIQMDTRDNFVNAQASKLYGTVKKLADICNKYTDKSEQVDDLISDARAVDDLTNSIYENLGGRHVDDLMLGDNHVININSLSPLAPKQL